MLERAWWSNYVKPAWHKPAKGWAAWKVEDKFKSGLPDVDACFRGIACKIELKYAAKYPKLEDTALTFSTVDKVLKTPSIVSAGQWNHLQQWHDCGGLAFVCIGVGKDVFLFRQGDYIQEGMTKAEMYDRAHTYVQCRVYSDVAAIAQFIEDTYSG